MDKETSFGYMLTVVGAAIGAAVVYVGRWLISVFTRWDRDRSTELKRLREIVAQQREQSTSEQADEEVDKHGDASEG